jgi:hypothetical protein
MDEQEYPFQTIDTLDAIIARANISTSDTLFVFDVVNVLLQYNDLILRPSGISFFKESIKDLQKTYKTKTIPGQTRTMPLAEFLEGKIIKNLMTVSTSPLDDRMPSFIKELHNKKIKAIALSAGKVDQYADFECMADCRLSQLKNLNFCFDNHFPQNEYIDLAPYLMEKSNSSIFKQGVILTANHSKGQALNAFLDAINWTPSEVIMIDDQKKWLIDVDLHMKTRKIHFHGFHLQHKVFANDIANEVLFKFQFDYLKKYHIWLNDKEALNLLSQEEFS